MRRSASMRPSGSTRTFRLTRTCHPTRTCRPMRTSRSTRMSRAMRTRRPMRRFHPIARRRRRSACPIRRRRRTTASRSPYRPSPRKGSGYASRWCRGTCTTVDLLIFPEMVVVGYPPKNTDPNQLKTSNFRSREEAVGYLEDLPPIGTARNDIDAAKWPSSRRLANAAADNGIALHAGLLELNGRDGKPFNTALVFDKTGKLVARHRKHNVNDPLPLDPADEENEAKAYYEREYLSQGEEATVYAHPTVGRVGVMTCADMYPSVNAAGVPQEQPPHWREKYLTAGFAFMAVSSAWNDPWKAEPEDEWKAETQAKKVTAWANQNLRTKRYVGFANTFSNGAKPKEGFTALLEPVDKIVKETRDDRVIVIGYVPAP
ncbi:MAG: carbon-nitrogen hydrolase family protein [Kofleriaceae bacterium]